MKKGIVLLALFITISISFVGCNIDDEPNNIETDYSDSGEVIEDNKTNLVLEGGITKLYISKLKNSDATDLDLSGSFNDKETLKVFKNILLDAIEEEGIVNMANPEFYLELTYKDSSKQGFNLWPGKDGQKGSLMETNDTHTIYTISEETMRKLTELMK